VACRSIRKMLSTTRRVVSETQIHLRIFCQILMYARQVCRLFDPKDGSAFSLSQSSKSLRAAVASSIYITVSVCMDGDFKRV
jgi:hypothetical protein